MSTPRYVPRSFCEQPRDFGKLEVISWKPMSKSEPVTKQAQHLAARRQHGQIVRLRQGLEALEISTADYAELCGLSYDRMVKVLRGVAVLHLEDIAMAEVLVHRPLRDRIERS